jgi:hypothetical protein
VLAPTVQPSEIDMAFRHPLLILLLLGALAFAAVPSYELVSRRPEARAVLADAERQVAGLDPRLVPWQPIADQARAAVASESRP